MAGDWSRRTGIRRTSLVARTVVSAALIAAFSVGGAHYLADQSESERRTLARLAGLINEEPADVLTTGSVAGSAARTKLDPCAVEPRRR